MNISLPYSVLCVQHFLTLLMTEIPEGIDKYISAVPQKIRHPNHDCLKYINY